MYYLDESYPFLETVGGSDVEIPQWDAIYKFLSITKIHDYDDLNTLFFQVLARDMGSRTHSIMRDFAYVPYLNSSLFEVTDLESKTIKINSLSQRTVLPVLASSVLRNKKRNLQVNALPTLQYLFAFLDAYNFASEGSEEVQEEAKTLINASVLGLIFEKINGHKVVQYSLQALSLCSCAVKQSPRPCCKSLMVIMAGIVPPV